MCELLNICSASSLKSTNLIKDEKPGVETYDRIASIMKTVHHNAPLPKSWRRMKRSLRLNNTITVAHITDIHVEPMYQNVSTIVLNYCQMSVIIKLFLSVIRPGIIYATKQLIYRIVMILCDKTFKTWIRYSDTVDGILFM